MTKDCKKNKSKWSRCTVGVKGTMKEILQRQQLGGYGYGCASQYIICQLVVSYVSMWHVEKDKQLYHFRRGCNYEGSNGRVERAGKHYIIAANLGENDALEVVQQGFARGFVSKEVSSRLSVDIKLLWMQRKVSKDIHPGRVLQTQVHAV